MVSYAGKAQRCSERSFCLNPCCSGRWSRTTAQHIEGFDPAKVLILVVVDDGLVLKFIFTEDTSVSGLNPCCSGRWSRTGINISGHSVPSCLNPCCSGRWSRTNGASRCWWRTQRLNPCCSGRWSRTRPYKTILIINKLKNSTKQLFTFLNRKLTFP